eukprot:286366-Prymnesium_polylepis.1
MRRMSQWLRGGGGVEPDEFQPASDSFVEKQVGGSAVPASSGRVQKPAWATGCTLAACGRDGYCRVGGSPESPMAVPEAEGCDASPEYRPLHGDASGDAIAPASEATVWEAELREVYYSWASGFDQVLGNSAAVAAREAHKYQWYP